MNDIYSLSKQRYRNELSDKEMRIKRRSVLENTYGYRAHLADTPTHENHTDAETIVPPANKKKDLKTPTPSQNELQNDRSANTEENLKPSKEQVSSDNSASEKVDAESPLASENAETVLSQQPLSDHANEALIKDSDAPVSKSKIIPIAVALVVVLGVVGYLFTQGSENEQVQVAESANAQQVNLNEQYSAIIEKQNYSDASIALFLNFWPLAGNEQKENFLAELDEKILELDPEVSDRLAYLQALIRQSESKLVKQTKAIINGAQDNQAFAQLNHAWERASNAEKNVFIDYISTAYQDYVVDFENEQNVVVVEAILTQLDITSKVKSVESSTAQVKPVDIPIPQPSPSPEPIKTELVVSTPVAPAPITAAPTTPPTTEISQVDAQNNDDSVKSTATAIKPVEDVSANKDEPKVVANSPASSPNIKAPTVLPQPPTETKVEVPGNDLAVVPKKLMPKTVVAYTATINELLSKPSLRSAADSKVLAEATRELFKELRQQYSDQGIENPQNLAKKDTFVTYEQHDRFAFHFYDLELFFTQLNNNQIQADFKTIDAMKALAKLFNNAETPDRPSTE